VWRQQQQRLKEGLPIDDDDDHHHHQHHHHHPTEEEIRAEKNPFRNLPRVMPERPAGLKLGSTLECYMDHIDDVLRLPLEGRIRRTITGEHETSHSHAHKKSHAHHGHKSKKAHHHESASEKESKRPVAIADLAHRWDIPLSTVVESAKLFREYAAIPPDCDSHDMLKDGILNTAAMMALVCKLANKVTSKELKVRPDYIMGVIDKNKDGSIDFQEFTSWYNDRSFEEYMNLSEEEIEVRKIGKRLGVSAADMDFYKTQYDKYDADGSGLIDFDEFRELLYTLMKVPRSLGIPESRINHFWNEADLDGSGEVDLEEFVVFYKKYFDPGATHPMDDFYKGVRRSVFIAP